MGTGNKSVLYDLVSGVSCTRDVYFKASPFVFPYNDVHISSDLSCRHEREVLFMVANKAREKWLKPEILLS